MIQGLDLKSGHKGCRTLASDLVKACSSSSSSLFLELYVFHLYQSFHLEVVVAYVLIKAKLLNVTLQCAVKCE